MDLNHILNTDSSWKAARPSLPRPEQLAFTSSPHDLAIHQKTHRVNAYLIQPQSEHKRNDILYSLPSICSFDMPPPRLSDLYPVTYQYGLEQQNRSSSRYSGPQPSYLNDVQPITSSVPTAYASTYSRSSYKSLALSDLHIRPARGVFDPSFSFQESKSWCRCYILDNTILFLTRYKIVNSSTLTILQSTPISTWDTNPPSSRVSLVWKQPLEDSMHLIPGSRAPLLTTLRPKSVPKRSRYSCPRRMPNSYQ